MMVCFGFLFNVMSEFSFILCLLSLYLCFNFRKRIYDNIVWLCRSKEGMKSHIHVQRQKLEIKPNISNNTSARFNRDGIIIQPLHNDNTKDVHCDYIDDTSSIDSNCDFYEHLEHSYLFNRQSLFAESRILIFHCD